MYTNGIKAELETCYTFCKPLRIWNLFMLIFKFSCSVTKSNGTCRTSYKGSDGIFLPTPMLGFPSDRDSPEVQRLLILVLAVALPPSRQHELEHDVKYVALLY